MYIQENTK